MTGARANRVCFRQTCSLAMLSTALGAELVRRAKRWYFLVADYAFGTDARDRQRSRIVLRKCRVADGTQFAGTPGPGIATAGLSSVGRSNVRRPDWSKTMSRLSVKSAFLISRAIRRPVDIGSS